tara:strand:- start:38 stop:631 length:594 start_codon:yes stop_codon:yes gene_type:complete
MRLISLATDEDANDGGEAVIDNTFNAEILIGSNSQIAMSSIVTEFSISTNDQLEAFEPYFLELTNIELESYYGRTDFANGLSNGSRKNFIATIPPDQLRVVVPLRPSYFAISGVTITTPTNLANPTAAADFGDGAVGSAIQYRLRWTPSNPIFLNISNKEPFALRQLGVRLLDYEGNVVTLEGAMFVDLLVRDSLDK